MIFSAGRKLNIVKERKLVKRSLGLERDANESESQGRADAQLTLSRIYTHAPRLATHKHHLTLSILLPLLRLHISLSLISKPLQLYFKNSIWSEWGTIFPGGGGEQNIFRLPAATVPTTIVAASTGTRKKAPLFVLIIFEMGTSWETRPRDSRPFLNTAENVLVIPRGPSSVTFHDHQATFF